MNSDSLSIFLPKLYRQEPLVEFLPELVPAVELWESCLVATVEFVESELAAALVAAS